MLRLKELKPFDEWADIDAQADSVHAAITKARDEDGKNTVRVAKLHPVNVAILRQNGFKITRQVYVHGTGVWKDDIGCAVCKCEGQSEASAHVVSRGE